MRIWRRGYPASGSRVGVFASAHEVKLVLVNRACTLLIVGCVGACFAQAASALEMNSLSRRAAAASTTQLGRLLSALEFRRRLRRYSMDDRADERIYRVQRNADQREVRLQFSDQKFCVRTRRLAGGGQLRRPIHRALLAGVHRGRLVAEHELARHRDRQVRLFVRAVAALRQGRLRLRRASVRRCRAPPSSVRFRRLRRAPSSTAGPPAPALNIKSRRSSRWDLNIFIPTSAAEPKANGGAPITGSPEVYSTALKSQSLLGRLNYKAGW